MHSHDEVYECVAYRQAMVFGLASNLTASEAIQIHGALVFRLLRGLMK